MPVTRSYTTTLDHADVEAWLRIVSFPAAALQQLEPSHPVNEPDIRSLLAALMPEADGEWRQVPIWPKDGPGLTPGMSGLRDLVAIQVAAAIRLGATAESPGFADVTATVAEGYDSYARSAPVVRELVDHAVHTPIIPVERSSPVLLSMADAVGATGGLDGVPALASYGVSSIIGAISGVFGVIVVKALGKGADTAAERVGMEIGEEAVRRIRGSQDELLRRKLRALQQSNLTPDQRGKAESALYDAWSKGELRP